MVRSLILIVALTISAGTARAGLIIDLTYLGGNAPTLTGTGSLTSTMEAAAQVWELAFNDASINHTLSLSYAWSPLDGGTLGRHTLWSQGGDPNRETSGQIIFDNSGRSFFADGTLDPLDPINSGNSEYQTYLESDRDYGGGALNRQREFRDATGDAAGQIDLYSVALHEIGHALGLSSGNVSYRLETLDDNAINVNDPLPFSGSVIATTNPAGGGLNAHLQDGGALMFPSVATGVRKLPTALDILANAQLSQFLNPNLDLNNGTAVPEPGSLLVLAGATLLMIRRQRKTRAVQQSA